MKSSQTKTPCRVPRRCGRSQRQGRSLERQEGRFQELQGAPGRLQHAAIFKGDRRGNTYGPDFEHILVEVKKLRTRERIAPGYPGTNCSPIKAGRIPGLEAQGQATLPLRERAARIWWNACCRARRLRGLAPLSAAGAHGKGYRNGRCCGRARQHIFSFDPCL